MKFALITGGGRGIGKAIAMELAAKGYNILIVARTEFDLKQACIEIEQTFAAKTEYFVTDLSQQDSIANSTFLDTILKYKFKDFS